MSKFKKIIAIIVIIILLIIIFALSFCLYNLSPVDSHDETYKEIVIEPGMGRKEIANLLEEKGIVKNGDFFYYYMRFKKANLIYAASYSFSSSMKMREVLDVLLEGGKNNSEISITFREGINMRDIAKVISENTNNSYDDVINKLKDTTYLDSLIEEYWFLTEDIKNPSIYYSLEGYLFPDTYNFDSKDVKVEEIFKVMLDEMGSVLKNYQAKIEKSDYSIHQIITLASVVEAEEDSKEDRKDVASVFYNRLNNGMSLGSDVTTYYAVQINMGDRELTNSEINMANPYNTRGPEMFGKLPVGPISIPSKSSLEAAIEPNKTSYLFFVHDKNGKIYLTENEKEHNKVISELQEKGLWYEW